MGMAKNALSDGNVSKNVLRPGTVTRKLVLGHHPEEAREASNCSLGRRATLCGRRDAEMGYQ